MTIFQQCHEKKLLCQTYEVCPKSILFGHKTHNTMNITNFI